MNIRKIIYLAKDSFRGSIFRLNTLDLKTEFSESFINQEDRIATITQYAINNTPYYSTYKNYNSFNDYPVLDKSIIKKKYELFFSRFYKDKLKILHKVTTSGSYGTPFTFYLNFEKRNKIVSEIYYFGKDSNFYLGTKHAYIVSKKKSRFSQIIQNQLMITVDKLDDEWCKDTINLLKKNKIKILIGYPSAISRLAFYLYKNNTALPMQGIITISEVLTDKMHAQIQDGFKCNPVSRYSSEEFGVLANQDLSGDFFWLNQCNYLVEILELDSNRPVSLGEMGRIVVTDLFNKSMPLIRYDTGDLATPCEIRNGSVIKIESIEGRRLATIRNTDGEIISSFTINGALRESKDIVQFQFSQEGKKQYILRLVVSESVDEARFTEIYKKILGYDALIKFEYAQDIPAQKSGKRPYILQNYYS